MFSWFGNLVPSQGRGPRNKAAYCDVRCSSIYYKISRILSSFVEHFAKANAFCDIKVELKCEGTFHDAYLKSLASNDWQFWTL